MENVLFYKTNRKQATKPHKAVCYSFSLTLKQHLKRKQPANKCILLGFISVVWGCCLLPLYQLPEYSGL